MKARRAASIVMASIGCVVCVVIGSSPDYNPFSYWVTRMHDVCDAGDDRAAFGEFGRLLKEFGVRIALVYGDRVVIGHGCHLLVNATKVNEVEIQQSFNNPADNYGPAGDMDADRRNLEKSLQESMRKTIHRIPGDVFVRYVTSKGVFESVAADKMSDAVVVIRNGDSLMIVDVAENLFSSIKLRTKSP